MSNFGGNRGSRLKLAHADDFSPRKYDKFSYCVRRGSSQGSRAEAGNSSPPSPKSPAPSAGGARRSVAELREEHESLPIAEQTPPFQAYYQSIKPLTKRVDELFAVAEDGSISAPFVSPLRWAPGPLSAALPSPIMQQASPKQNERKFVPALREPSTRVIPVSSSAAASRDVIEDVRSRTWAAFVSDARHDFTEAELAGLSWDVICGLLKHYRYDSPVAIAHIQIAWKRLSMEGRDSGVLRQSANDTTASPTTVKNRSVEETSAKSQTKNGSQCQKK